MLINRKVDIAVADGEEQYVYNFSETPYIVIVRQIATTVFDAINITTPYFGVGQIIASGVDEHRAVVRAAMLIKRELKEREKALRVLTREYHSTWVTIHCYMADTEELLLLEKMGENKWRSVAVRMKRYFTGEVIAHGMSELHIKHNTLAVLRGINFQLKGDE